MTVGDEGPWALRGFGPGGERVVALVLRSPPRVLRCRYHPAQGFRWVRSEQAADPPLAGERLDGMALERTPLKPVLEELAHAVVAHRRGGGALPDELQLLVGLLSPGGEESPGEGLFDGGCCGGYAWPGRTMEPKRTRLPGVLGVVASALGLFFSAFSTHDYALHLDRQLHNTHCSFVPGLSDATAGANACTAAMYSPYSALFRDKFWGGIPISLFALGAYAFFLTTAVYMLTAGNAASKRLWQGFGLAALTPIVASLVMFTISLTKLGAFCKLCVGLYGASTLLFVAGILALKDAGKGGGDLAADATVPDPNPPFGAAPPGATQNMTPYGVTPPGPTQNMTPHGYPQPAYAVPAPVTPMAALESMAGPPTGGFLIIPALLAGLGLFALSPALVYASALPDYKPFLTGCGKLIEPNDKQNVLVRMPGSRPVEPALLFVDPLCPTCKAFHERLIAEDIIEKLDARVAIFPLDSECNWMLDRALHPGACVVAKAFLCGESQGKARQILDWSYANQEELASLGKAGKDVLRNKVRGRFPEIDACIDSKETKQRLDKVLHFAVDNKVPISTPQFFLGDTRVCDEDTDLGLRYTLGIMAPRLNEP